jgi:hypothetical protein
MKTSGSSSVLYRLREVLSSQTRNVIVVSASIENTYLDAQAMDVFRIELESGQFTLFKAHGYKPILRAASHTVLIEHVIAMTQGTGAVIRFNADGGVRELRVGIFDEDDVGR